MHTRIAQCMAPHTRSSLVVAAMVRGGCSAPDAWHMQTSTPRRWMVAKLNVANAGCLKLSSRLAPRSGKHARRIIDVTAVGKNLILAELVEIHSGSLSSLSFAEQPYDLLSGDWESFADLSWSQACCQGYWTARNPQNIVDVPPVGDLVHVRRSFYLPPTGFGGYVRENPRKVLSPRSELWKFRTHDGHGIQNNFPARCVRTSSPTTRRGDPRQQHPFAATGWP